MKQIARFNKAVVVRNKCPVVQTAILLNLEFSNGGILGLCKAEVLVLPGNQIARFNKAVVVRNKYPVVQTAI